MVFSVDNQIDFSWTDRLDVGGWVGDISSDQL